MATIFDLYSRGEIEQVISGMCVLIEQGVEKTEILGQFEKDMAEEIYDLAEARIKARFKGLPDNLYYNPEDLRFATPKVVADYRAKRLKCGTIVDLGCSVGMQSIAFAKQCNKVLAVEIDRRKLRYAQENAKILGIGNVEFILGDVLDNNIISKLKEADMFFCDPERLPEESERRIDTIRPDPRLLLEKYPDDIAMEFPPQISRVDFDCEKEYLSVYGQLNRLTLYFGKLKKTDVSAVALPSGERMEKNSTREFVADNRKGLPLSYLYDVDGAVMKAGMFWQLAKVTRTIPVERGVLTSDELVENPFFRNSFKVLETVHHDFDSVVHSLQKNNAGRVILRYNVLPQDYWTERNKYEEHLKGDKIVYLFLFEKAVIAEKV